MEANELGGAVDLDDGALGVGGHNAVNETLKASGNSGSSGDARSSASRPTGSERRDHNVLRGR